MFSSVSGSSSSKSSSVSKGIGGLVSGLDTDTLVENMTAGTQNKIDRQKQEYQKVTWKQEAYRTHIKGLMEFNDKYFSYTSSTNITDPSFFESYKVNNLSSKVGLSGKLQNASYVNINSISQLATKGKYTYKADTVGKIAGKFDTSDKFLSNLDGQTFTIAYDSKTYQLTFPSDFGKQMQEGKNIDGSDAVKDGKITDEAMKTALEKMLKDAGLGEKVSVKVSDGEIDFESTDRKKSMAISGTKDVMKMLGFSDTSVSASNGSLPADGAFDSKVEKKDFKAQVSGKSMTFYLDGVSKTITLDECPSDKTTTVDVQNWFYDNLNGKLREAFGTRTDAAGNEKQAVKFNMHTDGTFSFSLVDDSSTFAFDKADSGILGKNNVFGIEPQTSTKLNVNMTLATIMAGKGADGYGKVTLSKEAANYPLTIKYFEEGTEKELKIEATDLDDWDTLKAKVSKAGFELGTDGILEDKIMITAKDTSKTLIKSATASGTTEAPELGDGIYKMSINDVDFTFKDTTTLSRVLSSVSQGDTGVNMTYSSITGSFNLEAKNYGNVEKISVSTDGVLAKTLFGIDSTWQGQDGNTDANVKKVDILHLNDTFLTNVNNKSNTTLVEGQNAVAELVVNGEKMRVERTSNTIAVDGLNIELKNTHDATEAPITFDVSLDSDDVVEKVKEFIETYNGLISAINTAVTTRPDKDKKYDPLTDAQKEEMSEKEIEKWETEAKKTVLFNDSPLKNVLQSMRSALYGGVEGVNTVLSSIGITTGTYDKNGQLTLDEAKFRKALSDNPDQVTSLFTAKSSIEYSPNLTSAERSQRYKESGLMYRFQDILKDAVGTTTPKGSLLQIAGIDSDRTAGENQLTEKLEEINEKIEKLQKQLKAEQERIWKQFTNLETTIQKLNSQSESLLSQLNS